LVTLCDKCHAEIEKGIIGKAVREYFEVI
jgi:hypothetical protein